jgi:hypothetical protein
VIGEGSSPIWVVSWPRRYGLWRKIYLGEASWGQCIGRSGWFSPA